jgi:hypothetical protein
MNGIHASLEVDDEQSLGRNGGLKFILVLENKSAHDVIINNPLDLFRIGLLDHEGWPVQLPRSTNKLQINAQGPVELTYGFVVVDIQNGRASDVNSDSSSVKIGAGSICKYELKISEVQDTPLSDKITPTSKLKPIEAGRYTLDAQLILMPVSGDSAKVSLQTDKQIVTLS